MEICYACFSLPHLSSARGRSAVRHPDVLPNGRLSYSSIRSAHITKGIRPPKIFSWQSRSIEPRARLNPSLFGSPRFNHGPKHHEEPVRSYRRPRLHLHESMNRNTCSRPLDFAFVPSRILAAGGRLFVESETTYQIFRKVGDNTTV